MFWLGILAGVQSVGVIVVALLMIHDKAWEVVAQKSTKLKVAFWVLPIIAWPYILFLYVRWFDRKA